MALASRPVSLTIAKRFGWTQDPTRVAASPSWGAGIGAKAMPHSVVVELSEERTLRSARADKTVHLYVAPPRKHRARPSPPSWAHCGDPWRTRSGCSGVNSAAYLSHLPGVEPQPSAGRRAWPAFCAARQTRGPALGRSRSVRLRPTGSETGQPMGCRTPMLSAWRTPIKEIAERGRAPALHRRHPGGPPQTV